MAMPGRDRYTAMPTISTTRVRAYDHDQLVASRLVKSTETTIATPRATVAACSRVVWSR